MKDTDQIAESIRRMRDARVEPEAVYTDEETYKRLGRRVRYMGIPVELDKSMKGWYIR